jgi:K+-sensing histidine kinase KdpD
VSDGGPGIPEDKLKAVFEPFTSKAEGMGMGLSIARTPLSRRTTGLYRQEIAITAARRFGSDSLLSNRW